MARGTVFPAEGSSYTDPISALPQPPRVSVYAIVADGRSVGVVPEGGGSAGDFGGEAVGDVQEGAQFVGGRGKLVRVVVAGAARVGPCGGGRGDAANPSHTEVDVTGSFVAPLPMAMGLREATIR